MQSNGTDLLWFPLIVAGSGPSHLVVLGKRAEIKLEYNVPTIRSTTSFEFTSPTTRLVAAWFEPGNMPEVSDFASGITNTTASVRNASNVEINTFPIKAFGFGGVTIDESSFTVASKNYTSDSRDLSYQWNEWRATEASGRIARSWLCGYLRMAPNSGSMTYSSTPWVWDPVAQPVPTSYDENQPAKDILNDWLKHTITLTETGSAEIYRHLVAVLPQNFSTDTAEDVAF
jgi:hypothetical protein